MSARSSKAAVASEERGVQNLGKRDVGGVVSRQVLPQFPTPRQQHVVGVAPQREILKSIDGVAATSGLDLAGCGLAPQHLGYLDIDQMGRMQREPLVE